MEVRREEILSTTVELLDRFGLAATRVADVAVALDVSPALVFYHFGTKDDLVAEAFAHAVERDLQPAREAATRGDDPVDRLRRVLRLYGPTGRATGWRIWIDAWAVAQRDPHIRKVLQRLDQQWQDILRGVVDDGVDRGRLHLPRPGGDGGPALGAGRRAVGRRGGAPQRDPRAAAQWVAAQLAVELGVGTSRCSDGVTATSHQPVGLVVGLGQRGPVQPERRHVGRRPPA